MLDRVRAFTHARQRLGRAAPDAASALRDVLFVYSSHPSAPLALSARAQRMTAADFRALPVLRTHAVRGSVHLMPPDAGARAFRALPATPAEHAARMRTFGLTEERFQELRTLVLEIEEPLSRPELAKRLDVTTQEATAVTASMARQGDVVRVGAPGLRSNTLKYAVQRVPEHERDAALAWLVGEYLRTLGPATLEDVVWWCGTTKGRAQAALAEHATVDVGDGLLLRAEDQADFEAAGKPGGVDLLGKWDPLTMGHAPAGRARAGLVPDCYDHRGDGLPVLLAGGVAVGTWNLTVKEGFVPAFFEPPGARLRAAIDARAAEGAALLA